MIIFVKLTLYSSGESKHAEFRLVQTFNFIYLFIFLDNECTALPPVCHVNAFCNDTYGSYRCTCNSGFSGNGENCTGTNAYVIE